MTDKLRRIPEGETLRGPISREDLAWHLQRLSYGRAPGPDEVLYEFLKRGPEPLQEALPRCLDAVLEEGLAPSADWLGGLVRFLHKPGGDPLEVSGDRPVCLLNSVYKILSAIINDRLYRLCERHKLLDPSQEGFRRLRCAQQQVQSLHRTIADAARRGEKLYLRTWTSKTHSTPSTNQSYGDGWQS